MNRTSFALFVALLIHLLFLLLFWFLGTIEVEKKKEVKPKENKIKISLKEMPSTKEEAPKKYKKSGLTKQKVKPPKIAPPMPKGSQLKKIIKKPKVTTSKPKPKPKATKPKATTPKPKPKPYIPLYNPIADVNLTKKESPKKEKKDINPLYAMLLQDKSAQEEKTQETKSLTRSSINQNIKELYGETFGKLSQGQQEYILDNQEIMRRITQQVLTRVARVKLTQDINVNRSNVIEFYLHPNGDMSDFKFLEKSGYYILDDTTKETIEYAYSRYPRPKEKTLIRYNVFYNLARY